MKVVNKLNPISIHYILIILSFISFINRDFQLELDFGKKLNFICL